MEEMSDKPYEYKEPESFEKQDGIWARGLFMVLFIIFFSIAETLLAFLAVIQFFWMLLAKEKNAFLVDFGKSLSRWMHDVAQFQTGASDDKPFPWKNWGA